MGILWGGKNTSVRPAEGGGRVRGVVATLCTARVELGSGEVYSRHREPSDKEKERQRETLPCNNDWRENLREGFRQAHG